MSIPGTGIYNRTYTKGPSKVNPPIYTSPSSSNTNLPASKGVSGRGVGRGLLYVLGAVLIYFVLSAIGHLL